MLFNDGDYIIYIIQHVYKDKAGEKWDNSGDCEQFIQKGLTREQWDNIVYKEPFRSLNACGECWQKTGIKGTFNILTATEILVKVTQWAPEYKFRVAELKVSQHATQVC